MAGVFLVLGGNHVDERTHLSAPSRGVGAGSQRAGATGVGAVTDASVTFVTGREPPSAPPPTSISIATIRASAASRSGDADGDEDSLSDRHRRYLDASGPSPAAGAMLRFDRKRFSGSYRALSAARRPKLAP